MSLNIGVSEGKGPKAGGIDINQIALITAISNELCRQVPGLTAEPRLYNSVIAAANLIVEAFAKPIVKASPGMGLSAWLASDDVGASSRYMAYILTGGDPRHWYGRREPEPAYPHDVGDLGRCIRLVRAVPEMEQRVHLMHTQGDKWFAVAANWVGWVQMYDDEQFEELYDAMKAAYGEA